MASLKPSSLVHDWNLQWVDLKEVCLLHLHSLIF